jgi:hypothetical protein
MDAAPPPRAPLPFDVVDRIVAVSEEPGTLRHVSRDFARAVAKRFPSGTPPVRIRSDASDDTITWAASCGARFPGRILRGLVAARRGRLLRRLPRRSVRRLQYAHDYFHVAALNEDLPVMRFILEMGCDFSYYLADFATAAAAKRGNLPVLKWLRENGCPWDEKTCANAASSGALHCLQWAVANGCPWDSRTCVEAAKAGHVHVLRWAAAKGAPVDEREIELAALSHPEIRPWLAWRRKKAASFRRARRVMQDRMGYAPVLVRLDAPPTV